MCVCVCVCVCACVRVCPILLSLLRTCDVKSRLLQFSLPWLFGCDVTSCLPLPRDCDVTPQLVSFAVFIAIRL